MFLLIIFRSITYILKPTSNNSPGFSFHRKHHDLLLYFSHSPILARAVPGMMKLLGQLAASLLWRFRSVTGPALFGIFNRNVYEDTGSRITKSTGDSKPVKIPNMTESVFKMISTGWNAAVKPKLLSREMCLT